jgi:hypothetical protein
LICVLIGNGAAGRTKNHKPENLAFASYHGADGEQRLVVPTNAGGVTIVAQRAASASALLLADFVLSPSAARKSIGICKPNHRFGLQTFLSRWRFLSR